MGRQELINAQIIENLLRLLKKKNVLKEQEIKNIVRYNKKEVSKLVIGNKQDIFIRKNEAVNHDKF